MGLFDRKSVDSFDRICWRISGMRSIRDYEIVRKGESAELAEYERYYREGKDERRPLRRGSCPAEQILELLNACAVLKWDGFHGKHPRGVKDGEMMSFEAEVNEGVTIKASGSENFPKHFGDFRREVNGLLKPVEEGSGEEGQ